MVIYSSSFPQPVWFVLLPAILLSVRNLACPRHLHGLQIRDRRISGEVRAQPGKTPHLDTPLSTELHCDDHRVRRCRVGIRKPASTSENGIRVVDTMSVDGYVPLSSAWGETFGELNAHEDALHRGKPDIFH